MSNSKLVPFTILVPPISPEQETLSREVMVEVTGEGEAQIITAESLHKIDIIKMQMMIKRLNDTVRRLTGCWPKE